MKKSYQQIIYPLSTTIILGVALQFYSLECFREVPTKNLMSSKAISGVGK